MHNSACIRLRKNVEFDEFTETRFLSQSEQGYFVPCHLLTPKNIPLPAAPLALCCNGHGGGMHLALGREKKTPIKNHSRNDPTGGLTCGLEKYKAENCE